MQLLLENWRENLKEDQEYQIYCDMDGVLVDFEEGVVNYITSKILSGQANDLRDAIQRSYIEKGDLAGPTKSKEVRKYMYKHIGDNEKLWANLPWTKHGKRLWRTIAPHNPYILTAPMREGSEKGKHAWIKRNLNPAPEKIFMSHEKYEWSAKNHILIDDFTKNTIPWEQAGGIAILHSDNDIEKTLDALRELGL